jgi:hypothetical protein
LLKASISVDYLIGTRNCAIDAGGIFFASHFPKKMTKLPTTLIFYDWTQTIVFEGFLPLNSKLGKNRMENPNKWDIANPKYFGVSFLTLYDLVVSSLMFT